MRILFSIVANMVALWATTFVPGIRWDGSLVTLLIAGLVVGLVNLIVRPIAMLLSLPLLILTLGLFYFVINGLMLWLASLFVPGYIVRGAVAAIVGALVMTVVNWALQALFSPSK